MESLTTGIFDHQALRVVALLVTAMVAGAASMVLYRWVSPQDRLAELKLALKLSQQKLAAYDGDFSGLSPLIRTNLGLASRQVGWSIGPSLFAGLPLLLIGFNLDVVHRNLSYQDCRVAAISEASPPVAAIPESAFQENDSLGHDSQRVKTHARPHDRRDYLPFGPAWMRSWITLFVIGSTSAAICVRHYSGAI